VLNLWCAEGVRAVKLAEVQRLRFANPVIENEMRRALETLALSHDAQKKAVSLHFAGEGKRKVEVGYVIENPIWKTSYRLVLDEKNAKPYLQGWAIVENPTDEDWQHVTMALVSRLRLDERDEVAGLLSPYLDGTKDSFAKPSQSSLAAHLAFFEYTRRAGDDRAKALVVRAANSGFTENGGLREFMPLHGGWSDSLFMDVPILAMAGALTGERRYFDMAARHVAFMQQIVRRPDGLYRHQASTEAAWGRGNAFPALGLALTLSEFPKDHPDYPRLLATYRTHMAALARFQDENGMWRNVIDRPGAYPEYSATAMIATAMLRGVRNGWIDRETYEPLIQKAWTAILARTGADGRLVDVCESTGTRGLTDEDYLRRTAILGRDDRGGGMAMFFATELAGL